MAGLRSSVVLFVLLLALTTISTSKEIQAPEPTAEDCQPHIDAAIKNFVANQQEEYPEKLPDKAQIREPAESDEDSSEESAAVEDNQRPETDAQEDEQSEEIISSEDDETQSDEDAAEQQSAEESSKDEIDNAKKHDKEDSDESEEVEETSAEEVAEAESFQEESDEESAERGKRQVDDSNTGDRDISAEESDERNDIPSEDTDIPGTTDSTGNETKETSTEVVNVTSAHSTPEQPKEEEEEEEEKESDTLVDSVEEPDNVTKAEEEEEEEVISAGPGELRPHEKIDQFLGLVEPNADLKEQESASNAILKDVKRLYETAVRPLEQLYKFKDISNRHIGDAEIFSKPIIVFMGPWSTGKSAIINYLLGTEYSRHALKTGAEPTTNRFTVITYGEKDQIVDGTQLAADWAFSTLQKFGQTFLDKLKGRRLPNPLLQKVTIVDTPGIFENRKSSERKYPFNDAFQWFIDRADLIYIVFDPTKLDVGTELEALFDQLKGRESNVRILLNKADTVKPQELMKVQGTLLWNLSPEMSTSEAPTVFVGSFWSRPYLPGSPVTLLEAQEEAFLEDLDEALKDRVKTKVALARRHAVRVRNHAKMVDCYLTTYYNHKSIFSNKRKVADDIIENPQNYHIYEGLSTMTNVSRYDLPDPEIYREFFHLHPLFDFKPLASTCSYFKGCPLDKLDIVIAYDLPELVTKYHKLLGGSQ